MDSLARATLRDRLAAVVREKGYKICDGQCYARITNKGGEKTHFWKVACPVRELVESIVADSSVFDTDGGDSIYTVDDEQKANEIELLIASTKDTELFPQFFRGKNKQVCFHSADDALVYTDCWEENKGDSSTFDTKPRPVQEIGDMKNPWHRFRPHQKGPDSGTGARWLDHPFMIDMTDATHDEDALVISSRTVVSQFLF